MARPMLIFMAAVLCASAASAQPAAGPWAAENLQYFPKDVTRPALTQRMREFSFALGVRCQYCHAGGNGITFDGVSFPSDEKPAKIKARTMLRMVDQINTALLPQLASRVEPRAAVDCATCHRGLPIPRSLQTTLFEIAQAQGAPAAIEKYRQLRRDALLGQYNFGEWEINELARRLTDAGNVKAALAMLEMNQEFYPASMELPRLIAAAKKLLDAR